MESQSNKSTEFATDKLDMLNEQNLVAVSEMKFSVVTEKTLQSAPVTMQTSAEGE